MNQKLKNKLPYIIGVVLLIITIVLFVIAILNNRAYKSENKTLYDKVNKLEQEKITSINKAIAVYQESIKILNANDKRRGKQIDSLLIAISKKEKQIIIKNNEIDNLHSGGLVNELNSIFTKNNIE